MTLRYDELVEKYDLRYDNWDAEEAEQREWDRLLAAGLIS